MKKERRIYCIEGHWDYGNTEVEPSVEPILQMLQKHGVWNYTRRDCATQEELQFWLKYEWKRCKPGSILYIASHGSAGCTRLLHKQPPAHVKRWRSVLREHVEALFPGFRCCSWRGSICRLGESYARHIG